MSNDIAAQRRHPQEGGYARGEETRARIIAAALQIFGEQGYDQASTRQIAASAGVNPPALQYYFGGKEGLHRACAQHIIERVSEVLDPAYERAVLAARAGAREEAIAAQCGLLEAMVDGLMTAGAESWGRFIARGKADGAGPAMAMIHERIGLRLRDATVQLVAAVTGQSAQDETIRLRAGTLMAQVTNIYANREYLLPAMGWTEFDARALGLIKSVVTENTRLLLTGWSGARSDARKTGSAGPRPRSNA